MIRESRTSMDAANTKKERRSLRSSKTSVRSNVAPKLPDFLGRPKSFLPPILLILTCIKIMLIPSYRSTDFDVHRNWLAITHKLPISQWYFDNVNGTTVHTLDYPPAFAYFEWILSNNPLTALVIPEEDRCLELLSDNDNEPSPLCVVFHRSTVILSDVILWLGAWLACRAFHYQRPIYHTTLSFLMIILNPGLIWLDHIHFQYNGMLLGVLLASLGLLMLGNHLPSNTSGYHYCHLGGAALYAFLLNLKHLYLTLAPIYFCYLFHKYCFVMSGKRFRFSLVCFLQLAAVTAGTLLLPWVPFLIQSHPNEQFVQIFARLFPFGRGLVHDYWAANVWAIFSFADKIVRTLESQISWFPVSSLPEPSPMVCAFFLLVSILPAMLAVSFRPPNNTRLLQSVVYASFCAFMLAYHVHEKAILTPLLPLAVLVERDGKKSGLQNFLFAQSSLWGLLGLFPLLFRRQELAFKLFSYFTYLKLVSLWMRTPSLRIQRLHFFSSILAGGVVGFLEFVPTRGRWEFLPLMVVSIVCAQGLIGCWALSLWLLLQRKNSSEDTAASKAENQ